MSESGESEGGNWWSSWLTTAKEKSMSALSATKRDLAEFVTVISTDTRAAVTDASAKAQQIIRKPDGAQDSKPVVCRQPTSAITTATSEPPAAPYDRCKAQLFTLQNSPDTYLTNPKDDKAFEEWKATFDVQAQLQQISSLLVNCSRIRTLHAQLIPAQVSYELFWQRYFYKVQLHQQEEERRAWLMARANPRHETLQWDEDEEETMTTVSKVSSDHARSGSSDSFVCVSEDTLNEARERQQAMTEFDPLDPDGWGLVMPVVEGESGREGEKEEAGQKEEEERKEEEEEEGELEKASTSDVDAGSSNSDWESWDD